MSSSRSHKGPSRRQVKSALELHAEELGQHPNVVGMGIVRLDGATQESLFDS